MRNAMKHHGSKLGMLAALPALLLAACEQKPQAPIIPPTELAAINTPPPEYPEKLACAGIGGTVVFRVTIARNGKPAKVEQIGSSGQSELDQSAMKAVRDWEFKAGTRNGKPWVQGIQVPVTFTPPVEKPTRCFQYDK
ncbi:energy transducer TonB [Pseudoxanthomonas helianthi]|nr:energy transducer TonB [Pseudoxanthomonas helianthi]